MLFNSLQFAFFFIGVYAVYLWLDHKWQNRLLLAASYIFYGAWDWRFLSLIFISTGLDYCCGLKIHSSEDLKIKKRFLFFSVAGNLILLGIFKYFNFFIANLQAVFNIFGISLSTVTLEITLPVGISFYTFQTMSYTLDIYRGRLKPTRRFLDFALFVAFFPQLVAGPIERARRFLPQILSPRVFRLDRFYEGCYLIYWGLFQKVFVADNLARIVDGVIQSGRPFNGGEVLIALYAFSFQIFCDFAGYSNIARGLAKVMGFELMVNFDLPYFVTNPSDFWKKWHISLSSWLRDYLYIPLGGNKKGSMRTLRNLIITMLLGGLWHGAAGTFILWGLYHALLLIAYNFAGRLRSSKSRIFLLKKSTIDFLKGIFFFHLVGLGWLVFRAESLGQAGQLLRGLFLNFSFEPGFFEQNYGKDFIFYVWLLLAVQIVQFKKQDHLFVLKCRTAIRGVFYFILYFLIVIYGAPGGKEFVYFQF